MAVEGCFTPRYRNILHPALVDRSNVILPPLHIKLGLMKQFVKALNKEGACFKSIQEKFPYMSEEKVIERMYLSDIKLENSPKTQFLFIMTDVEIKDAFPLQKYYQNFLATLKILTTKRLLKTCWLVLKHLDVA